MGSNELDTQATVARPSTMPSSRASAGQHCEAMAFLTSPLPARPAVSTSPPLKRTPSATNGAPYPLPRQPQRPSPAQLRQAEHRPSAFASTPRSPPPQQNLLVGKTIDAVVTRVEPYGAFVDGLRDDISGLVHISKIADRYVSDVAACLAVGDRVRVKVLPPDARGRTPLSMKDAERTGRDLVVHLGGDPGDAWNADGKTVWANLGPRSGKTHYPWEGDPALFTFDHNTLPEPPPRHPPYPEERQQG
jgi:S1 RNA binding domain